MNRSTLYLNEIAFLPFFRSDNETNLDLFVSSFSVFEMGYTFFSLLGCRRSEVERLSDFQKKNGRKICQRLVCHGEIQIH